MSYVNLYVVYGVYAAATYVLLFVVQTEFLAMLLGGNIVITISSRVPQILQNFQAKSTGSLSVVTWILQFGGAAARIFTTFKETDSISLLATYILSAGLNGIVVAQILIFGDAGEKKKKEE